MLGNMTVNIPNDYNIVQSGPGDPVGSMSFLKKTTDAACLVMYNAIPTEQAMLFNSPETIIEGIHAQLAPNQGIIEVNNGVTVSGKKFIYSVIKTVNSGVEGGTLSVKYSVVFHMGGLGDAVFQAQGYFDETGYIGNRDSSVYAILQREGKVGPNGEGWMVDPYDANYTRGALMNQSEKAEFDEAFKDYPLSQLRRLISELINGN